MRRLNCTLGSLLVVFFAVTEIASIRHDRLPIDGDFLGTFYWPARAVLHGQFPYGHPGTASHLAGSVYPPSAFEGFAWIGLFSPHAAVIVWTTLIVLVAAATLWVLDVRDWRCYGLWLLTPLMLSTIAAGNGTVLVISLVALAWRWRNTASLVATALVAAIAIKLYAAPLILWLLLTRRFRAAAYTTAGTVIALVGGWAVIGFAGMRGYLALSSTNTRVFGASGPFLQALVRQLDGSQGLAFAVGLLAAGLLVMAARERSDVMTFALVLCATILVTPVAWVGMLGLLIVPIATIWPRLSGAWLLLLLGSYAHWYLSPLPYRSVELSVVTLSLLVATMVMIGGRLSVSREGVRQADMWRGGEDSPGRRL